MRIVPALSLAGALLATGIATPALAGPPFVTDDPEPTDLHKWEIYNFALGTIENGTAAAANRLEMFPAESTRNMKNGTPRAVGRDSVVMRWQTCSKLAPNRAPICSMSWLVRWHCSRNGS